MKDLYGYGRDFLDFSLLMKPLVSSIGALHICIPLIQCTFLASFLGLNRCNSNTTWMVGITYIATHEGWLYLVAILDVYTAKMVGWSMSSRVPKQIVADALKKAVGRRQLAEELIHHSDQRSTPTVSMSRVDNCYDNAMEQSLYATRKTERADRRDATCQQVHNCLSTTIELWYNRRRRHFSLGYLRPVA